MVLLHNEVVLNNKKEQTIDTWDTLDESQRHVEWKKLVSKDCILYDSTLMTWRKRQNYSDGEQIRDGGKPKEFWGGDGAVLYPDCGDGYTNTYIC